MEEKKSANGFLEEVGPVVAAAEMGELVNEDGPEFGGGELAKGPCGQNDGGVAEAEGRGDGVRFQTGAGGWGASSR
jgi:hypothetical protein